MPLRLLMELREWVVALSHQKSGKTSARPPFPIFFSLRSLLALCLRQIPRSCAPPNRALRVLA